MVEARVSSGPFETQCYERALHLVEEADTWTSRVAARVLSLATSAQGGERAPRSSRSSQCSSTARRSVRGVERLQRGESVRGGVCYGRGWIFRVTFNGPRLGFGDSAMLRNCMAWWEYSVDGSLRVGEGGGCRVIGVFGVLLGARFSGLVLMFFCGNVECWFLGEGFGAKVTGMIAAKEVDVARIILIPVSASSGNRKRALLGSLCFGAIVGVLGT